MSEKARIILGIVLAFLFYIGGVIFSIKIGEFILHWDLSSWGTMEAMLLTILISCVGAMLAAAILYITVKGSFNDAKDLVPPNFYPKDRNQNIFRWLVLASSIAVGVILLGLHVAEPLALLAVVLGVHCYIFLVPANK